MNISNEDIVACFSGAAWVGSEGNIRNRLGLPLGKGKLVLEDHNLGLKAMEDKYKNKEGKNNDKKNKRALVAAPRVSPSTSLTFLYLPRLRSRRQT